MKSFYISYTLLFTFFALIWSPGMAQKSPVSANLPPELNSTFGNVHTPKGHLHMLVVFVRYPDRSLMKDTDRWPDQSEEGVLPRIARGEVNDLFHKDPKTIGLIDRRNISDYFYHMSDGQFLITADIFPVQVPVKFIPERGGNFFSRQSTMNRQSIEWISEHYPDFDWSRYDQRTNSPGYRYDNQNSPPDSILDYVVFMHRAPGSTGMGASSSIDIPNSVYKIRNGHTGIKSYQDRKHNLEYFKHEFAHNLYNCPHYLGANTADGHRFYTQKGWGLMAAWHSAFFVANAWESWWLGWLEPQEITESGRYTLKDYMTGRDAIRIRIPGTADYFWLENHQKYDPWDEKLFFKDPKQGHPQSAPGLYGYVVGAIGGDQSKPRLNPFNASHANHIRMCNAEGNHDYRFTGDSISTGYFQGPVMEKVASNPFSGQNAFQFLRADYDHNGKISIGYGHGNKDKAGREQMDLWNEIIDKKASCTLACTGDENDGLQVGDEIGLSGIYPITNYPTFQRLDQQMSPQHITGISIKVVEQAFDGRFVLDIQFDDWALRQDQRWCGELLLDQADASVTAPLTIEKNVTLSLDLSGTPSREKKNELTGELSNPTHLLVKGNRSIVVKKGGRLIIQNHSHLEFMDQAQLIVEKGGQVIVQENGLLEFKDQSQLLKKGRGAVKVDTGGRVLQASSN